MNTWNLDSLYTSEESKEFKEDFNKLKQLIKSLNDYVKELGSKDVNETIVHILTNTNELSATASKLGAYLALRSSVDTTNEKILSLADNIDNELSNYAKTSAAISAYIGDLDFSKIDFNNKYIKEHEFYLNELKENRKYLLSNDVEEAIAKLNLNGSSMWSNLQRILTSTLKVDVNGEQQPLSQVRNMAYDPDLKVRKLGYDSEIKAYEKIEESVAFALNGIKGEANTIAELRGYKSVLEMTCKDSRVNIKTIETMINEMKKALPHFHKYLNRKAELLGYKEGLPFYEMFAPIGKSSSKFSVEESGKYLVEVFKEEALEISELIQEAYDNDWIDFLPKAGKVGGAFCYNLPFIKQSRVLTNFDGSLSDVITLAHELGHAYHGHCIQEHHSLNTNYSMPVAETASIFNETVVMNKVIKETTDKQEKIMLLESSLQDSTQVIVDIMSRFLFETEVVERRKNEFLFSKELNNMMLKAQKEAYGSGLDHKTLHPYMWINKSHYYSAGNNFYNFPYAFGLLFAKGLYAKFTENKKEFIKVYNNILKATTVSKVEDVALIANIDLQDSKFWRDSLKVITDQIDEFIELTNK